MKLYVVFYDNKSVQVFEDKMDAHEWALDTFGPGQPVDIRAFTDAWTTGTRSDSDLDFNTSKAVSPAVD